MFEFNTVIITKRGSGRENHFDVPATVHTFPASTKEEVEAIISHPSIAGWKYGISIGYANL